MKYGDIGTPEIHKRQNIAIVKIDGQPKAKVKTVSPVEHYYNKNKLDSSQRAAGEAVYRYFNNGWIGVSNCEYREPTDGGGITHMSDRQVSAQQQFKRIMNVLNKNRIDNTLVKQVCIDEKYISHIYHHWYGQKKALKLLQSHLSIISKELGYS